MAAAGVTPSALELIDRYCLEAVDAWKQMGLSTEADVVVLGRTDAPGEAGEPASGATATIRRDPAPRGGDAGRR